MSKEKEIVKILPLGGCGEFGRNCTIFEHDNEIIVVDCGIMFPSSMRANIDLIIPDMKYLEQRKSKIKALVLTHGHEDHIGAVVCFLQMAPNVPIYGTRFTLSLIRNRIAQQRNMANSTDLRVLDYRAYVKLCSSFSIELIRSTHSIVESASVLIDTPIGSILHSGDFKIDFSPVDNMHFDLQRFAEIGSQGLLCLLSDSTNVLHSGYTKSESTLYASFREVFRKAKKRIFISTFASHVHRVQVILDMAKEFKKKVIISGRNMEINVKLAKSLDLLKYDDDIIVNWMTEEAKKIHNNRLVIITTGTQGEQMSSLSLISNEKHRFFKIEKNDTVVVSARVIPGNEKEVSKMVDRLFRAGANVLYSDNTDNIHVSGHALQEELKLMIRLTRPKFFFPLHGDYARLVAHTDLARQMGILNKNSMVMENGELVHLTKNRIEKRDKIRLSEVFVSGRELGSISEEVLEDRRLIFESGIVLLIIAFDEKINAQDKLSFRFDLTARGFVQLETMDSLFKKVKVIMDDLLEGYPDMNEKNYPVFKRKIQVRVQKLFYENTRQRPLTIVRII